MTLEQFIGHPTQAVSWIAERRRKTLILIGKTHAAMGLRTLELVDVTCEPQQQGHFTAFLDRSEVLAAAAGFEAITVNDIQNKHLDAFLERRGYARLGFTKSRWCRLPRASGEQPPA